MRHKRPRSINKEKAGSTTTLTLGKLHPNIVCRLCRGYIVDCITIVECMHSFCKSCIVKYLNDQDERYECPKCGQIIHESNPWSYLAPDSALQTIIYKLVPGLQEAETKKCAEYYKRRGQSPPRKELEPVTEKNDRSTKPKHSNSTEVKTAPDLQKPADNNNHRLDEQISIQLISWQAHNGKTESTAEDISDPIAQHTADGKIFRPFLRLSCFATVNHLRKYLAFRLHGNIDRYADFELFCEGRPLYKEHTLKFIAATVWGRIVDQSEKKSIESVMPIIYRNRSIVTEMTDGEDDEEDVIDDKHLDLEAHRSDGEEAATSNAALDCSNSASSHV